MRIQNPVKHLDEVFNKKSKGLLTIDYFRKNSILDNWKGFEYASGLSWLPVVLR